MIDPTRNAMVARIVLVTGCFLLPGLFVLACTDTRRGLGEQCLKSEDCVSGLCVAQACASEPPLLTGTSTPPAEAGPDATVEADASGSDSGPVADATTDAPSDAAVSDAGADD